ncbi:basal cell adhesion molecule-like isoform X2 [Branchiostoma floridae x Branchiostoma belcheri]
MDCSGVAPLPWLVLTLLSTVSAALYRTRPESTEVLVNQTVTLYCAFNGLAPSDVVNWYWYNPEADDKLYHISARGRVASEFSRHSIVGSSRRGEYNLRIRDVQPGDEGNYRCSVFTVRDAGDARLTVVVPPPKRPKITGHKGPYVVGEELQLVCRTNGGKPLPSLMWYNGSEPLDPFGTFYQDAPIDDIVQTELRIPSLTKWEDSINISCIADQGVQGVASQKVSSIQLHIYYSPTVTVPINSIQALEGTYANLTCLVEGNPSPIISWTRDGDSLPQNAETSNSSLLIPRVSRSDSGAYLCEADNGIQPTVTGEINMEVIFPPRIKSSFDGEISVLYGQNVFRVDCLAEGNPKPNVTWRRKDTNQPYKNPLTLSPLNYQTEGIYVCVAKSKRFPEVTREAFINVIGRPEVVTEASSVSAAGGDTVELTCTIASDPVPEEIIWTLAGDDGKKTAYRTGRTGDVFVKKTAVVGDKIQSVLIISSAESAHTGDYACIASNMFGQDRQEFRVYVTEESSDVVVIAAVTMGVVLGVLFAVMATLCLRARNIWTSCRLSKSQRGTRRSESFSYCAGSEDELAAKSSLNISSKVPEDELATIELQKLNGISTHRSTSSLNSQPVVISSPFTEIKRAEYSRFTTDRSRCQDEEEEEKYPRHCPYYVGELTNRQETVKLLPSAKRKEDGDESADTIGSDPEGSDIQAKSTDHYQPEAVTQTNFV